MATAPMLLGWSSYWTCRGVWISCCNCNLKDSVAKSLVFALLPRGEAMTTASVCVLTRDTEAKLPD